MSAKELSTHQKQELYRDARFLEKYDEIWQNVGKCVFCDLNEKYIFFEENGIVMTISLFAYIDGHFMIIPRRHVRSVKDLTQAEWESVRKCLYLAKKLIKGAHKTNGMQLVQKDGVEAQSTVDHLHFHCIPFDGPDLTTWNYRQLENTPLENVAIYKKKRKAIIETELKFDQKYTHPSSLPITCDVIILNKAHEIMFQVRAAGAKLSPDYLTFPGGIVEDFSKTLEEELAREVFEEIGYKLRAGEASLLNSEITPISRRKQSSHLKAVYTAKSSIIRNTYIVRDFDTSVKLVPGDDAESIVWIPYKEALTRKDISPETRALLKRYPL